jgi:hypothetical protein
MDGACLSAVEQLKRAGARAGLPSLHIIESAQDGSQWGGRTPGGGRWKLTKIHRESYDVYC